MSVAYQGWEVTSGPSVAYKISIPSKSIGCSLLDPLPSDASSYAGAMLDSTESFLRSVVGGSDISKSLFIPNPKVLRQQDTITKGLSSLSLHAQQVSDASNSKSMDSNHAPFNESTISSIAIHATDYYTQGRASRFPNFTGLPQSVNDVAHAHNCQSTRPILTTPPNNGCIARNLPLERGHGTSDACYKHKLGVVIEDKALEEDTAMGGCDDLELDLLSSSSTDSISSLHDKPTDGCTSSSDGSHSVGEAEVQSEYRGFSSSSVGTPPIKKGLSQFYAGKSRSFSCLADVVSVKDLAKPENPYAKKRKGYPGRSPNVRLQLPPLQKGASSISKKLPHNGKATLALAVAMSVKEDEVDITHEKEVRKCVGTQKWQSSPLSSRSYSLSDLHGVGGIYTSPS